MEALSVATGSALQAAAPWSAWLSPDMYQQAFCHSGHRAQEQLSQTAIAAAAKALPGMVYSSASIQRLPQPVEYSVLHAFRNTPAHPEHTTYGHVADPWIQHKLQLQSVAAPNQFSIGAQEPACLSDKSDLLEQYASVPTSAVSIAAYQQQLQLQAAAAAALQNLHAGALQSSSTDPRVDSAVGPFIPSATLASATPVPYHTHISVNTALHGQQQTEHAPGVCSHQHVSSVMQRQCGQHQVAVALNASMYQVLPHQQIVLPDSQAAYNGMAICNASSLLAIPGHSSYPTPEYPQGGYAQMNLGSTRFV